MKVFIYIFLGIIGAASIHSCKPADSSNDEVLVATVFDAELYLSDISELIPDQLSFNDSVQTAQTIINKWITRQIKLNKAETYLTPDEKELEQKLEEYRSSLLIYKYEQQLIYQNLDTLITAEDIAEYYRKFSKEFILQKNAVKAIYCKFPSDSPNFYRFKRWMRSFKENDMADIEDYASEFGELYQNFNMDWVYLSDIIKYIPNQLVNVERFIAQNEIDELNDGVNIHLLKIVDHKLKGDIAPLMLVESNIRNIILNKRKLTLIRELEEQAFNEAMNNNKVEIYKL